MAKATILEISSDRVREMVERSRIRVKLNAVPPRGEIVGAVTPCVPTIEAVVKIGEAGGAVFATSHPRATGVVMPKTLRSSSLGPRDA